MKNGFQIARGEGSSQVKTIVGKITIVWGDGEKEKWLKEVEEEKEEEKEKE